jgi:hypothetical protein
MQDLSWMEQKLRDPEAMRLFQEYAQKISAPEVVGWSGLQRSCAQAAPRCTSRMPTACHAQKPPTAAVRTHRRALHATASQALAEQEAYLRQLEAEQGEEGAFGAGPQLVVPRPGLVLKLREAQGVRKTMYINICMCDKVRGLEGHIQPARVNAPYFVLPVW